MNNLTIFVLLSAIILTAVFVSLIPEMAVPDYSNSPIYVNKKQKTDMTGYQVEKITDVVCRQDSECVTPGEYLMVSRCPFTSKCVDGQCAVICPNFEEQLNL